jgi:hypothetical protein
MIALFLFLLWAALAYTWALRKKWLTAGKAEIVIACMKITTATRTFQENRHAQRSAAQQSRKEEA